ncbi:hypothetical protein [Paraburkholderia adhaesiva]|uniref:hypothetical protein n=1 Tax=Paraburkholderia adhaesiva TaxID=2883244 RepID=UPI001F4729F7|nr:hypothetical protein [Paraburkholderia adhaesiva]
MTSIKSNTVALLFLVLSTFVAVTAGASTVKTKKDLGTALEDAVLCKPKAWDSLVEENKESGGETFDRLGVVERPGNFEGSYVLPVGTKVFGYPAGRVLDVSTSVDVLYVELAAGPNEIRSLKDRLKMRPSGAESPYGYADYLDASYFRRIALKHVSGETDERAIVLGPGRRDDRRYVAIGCWSYSGDPG